MTSKNFDRAVFETVIGNIIYVLGKEIDCLGIAYDMLDLRQR